MSGSRDYLRVVLALAAKDLRSELRARETVTSLGTFGLAVLVIFGLALNPVEHDLQPLFGGIYWLAITFAALVALGRSFGREREGGTLEVLALLPVDRSAAYLAKAAVTGLWLSLLALLLSPLFFVLLHIDARPTWWAWVLATVAGVAGLVAVGTLLAALTVQVRASEMLLPLLLLPLVVPVLVAAVRLTDALVLGSGFSAGLAWFRLLVGYDIVFAVTALAVFDYVAEV